MVEGFLVVDKPSGLTSHDVVAAVRHATGVRRVGHAGTLDPLATGVVVVAVGRVTRLIRFIQDLPKVYLATAQFGVATDSLDADGAVLEREEMSFTLSELTAVLDRFTGPIEQVPPMVSALKVGGERLYEIARRGVTIEREARRVEVFELEVTDLEPGPYPQAFFRVRCGKGTYVRSLVDDIARALGGRAHLTALRRTSTGTLDLGMAVPIERLDEYRDHLLSPARALGDLLRVDVDAGVAEAVSHGAKFAVGPLADVPEGVPAAVVDESGDLLAVYRRSGREAKPEVVVAG